MHCFVDKIQGRLHRHTTQLQTYLDNQLPDRSDNLNCNQRCSQKFHANLRVATENRRSGEGSVNRKNITNTVHTTNLDFKEKW